ncbi:hypothetical protein [Gordonia sp. NPDC003376]
MSHVHRTTSMVSPLMLRKDLTREHATTHWRTRHADLVRRLPHVVEYNQLHFSATDHGYWPATDTVGTVVPSDWRVDGCSELRFTSTLGCARTGVKARPVYLDEHNAFERVVGQMTVPSGGRWWTDGHDTAVGHRTVVWLRRRRGVGSLTFRRHVYDTLAPALHSAGARDLRAYVFTPYTKLGNVSPGVSHDYPVQHRFHAALIIGADSREHFHDLVQSQDVAPIVDRQACVLSAAHAYGVERTVPVVPGTVGQMNEAERP